MTFRLLVTGSRTWIDEEMVRRSLTRALHAVTAPITLVHGGATGLDTIAANIARNEMGLTIECHPAQWGTHDERCPAWHEGERRCRMAGHRRNAEMVALGADMCLAYIRNGSPGATACANLAAAAGIPTTRYILEG